MLTCEVKLLFVMFLKRQLLRQFLLSERICCKREGKTDGVVLDVWIFNDLGADLGSSEIILTSGVTKVVGTLLCPMELGEDLCQLESARS